MASLWWVFFYMVHWTLEVNQERRPRVDLHEGATSIGQRAGVWDTETEREDMGGRGERVRDLIQQRREVIWWMSGHLSEVKAWGPSLCKGLNEAAGLALMGRASLHRFYFYFQGGVNNMQIQTHFPLFFVIHWCCVGFGFLAPLAFLAVWLIHAVCKHDIQKVSKI